MDKELQLQFITASLVSKKCILFLGPQFALNEQGEKLHVLLRRLLEKNGHELEYGFDNLFILKDAAKAQGIFYCFPLRTDIKFFYSNTRPHPVYRKIAAMPFRAVISCSPDTYLKDILTEKGIEHDFHFYSVNGNTTPAVPEASTILYNVFGTVDDGQSLIISYDIFYDFLISVMGEKYTIPANLQNALTDPEAALVFMGFDLEKWYIPLLVRRLKYPIKEKREAKHTTTALMTADNFQIDKSEIERRFHPIELILSDEEAVWFLEKLYERMKDGHSDHLYFEEKSTEITESVIPKINAWLDNKEDNKAVEFTRSQVEQGNYKDVAKCIRQFLSRNKVLASIDLCLEAFENKEGRPYSDLIQLRASFIYTRDSYTSGAIGLQEHTQQLVRIGLALLDKCDELES